MKLARAASAIALMVFSTLHYSQIRTIFSTSIKTRRALQENDEIDAEYDLAVKVFLNGEDALRIKSTPFFRSGLEQALKDFLNPGPIYESKPDLPFYRGVNIDIERRSRENLLKNKNENETACILINTNLENAQNINCYLVVKSKCKGKRKVCSERVNQRLLDNLKTGISNSTASQKDGCNLNISHYLADKTMSSSIFNFVPLGTSKFPGIQTFEYNFNSSSTNLSQPGDISASVDDIEISERHACPHNQCELQHEALAQIYLNFQVKIDHLRNECEHPGINCNSRNLITQIWLDNNTSSGSINEEIGELRSLRGIFFSHRDVTGTLPERLTQLIRLESLFLDDNVITGSIPLEIANLINLQEVNLNGNRLSGSIPSELINNATMRLLDLGNNSLNGTIPEFIKDSRPKDSDPFENCSSFLNFFPSFLSKIWQQEHETPREINLETLSVYENRLTGTISSSIFQIPKLKILNLGLNFLNGTLPSEIGQANQLRVFDIRGKKSWSSWVTEDDNNTNQLIGQIPSEIAAASRLEIVNLYNNDFTGSIPSEIMSLQHLTEIAFDRNKLTGRIPDFQPGTKLEIVSFGHNNISGTIPSSIWNLRNAVVLNLEANELSGSIPSEIGLLDGLEYLVLNGKFKIHRMMNETIPSELGNLRSLRELFLYYNGLTGSILTEFGKLQNLELIELDSNYLTGNIPSELGMLSNLKRLWLHKNELTGTIPSELRKLSNLKELYLSESNLTNSIPSELGILPNLETLLLHENYLIGSIPSELGSLLSLKQIALYKNDLTGTIPSELGSSLNLAEVWLHVNNLKGSIPSELGSLSSLKHLYLHKNDLTGTIPTELGSLSSLTDLRLHVNNLTGSIPSELFNISDISIRVVGNNVWFPCDDYHDQSKIDINCTNNATGNGSMPVRNFVESTTLKWRYFGH